MLLLVKEVQNGKVNWDIPAGGLKQGETVLEGVVREVGEETGITLIEARLQRTLQFFQGQDSSFNHLHIAYLTEKDLENIKITEEDIKEIRLFARQEVQELIDTNQTEHALATARLREFLNRSFEDIHVIK